MSMHVIVDLAFFHIQDPVDTLKETSWRPIVIYRVHDLTEFAFVKIKLLFRTKLESLTLKWWLELTEVALVELLIFLDRRSVIVRSVRKIRNLNIIEIEILMRILIRVSVLSRASWVALHPKVRSARVRVATLLPVSALGTLVRGVLWIASVLWFILPNLTVIWARSVHVGLTLLLLILWVIFTVHRTI